MNGCGAGLSMDESRWLKLMKAFALPECLAVFHQLESAYTEKHRFYHTAEHIRAMLNHFDSVFDNLNDPGLVELAIWFHDAIYQPFSKNNEEESAQWAIRFLNEQNIEKDKQDWVYRLIMATCHNGSMTTDDEKYLVDIDLSILGARPDVFIQYEKNIRREYRWVPGLLYKKKRKELLESFLARPSIYQTSYFQTSFESQARENLKQAIGKL